MFNLKIISKQEVAKNVFKFRLEKPTDFVYTPNQVVTAGASSDKRGMFTLTSCVNDDFLELIIKIYIDYHGVTEGISLLKEGDNFVAANPFGGMHDDNDILFIAGGSGITPFIAHLRNFESNNSYCLASYNKQEDVIEKDYIDSRSNCKFFLSNEKIDGYEYGRINKGVIEEVLKIKKFDYAYVCGPPAFENAMIVLLEELGLKGKKIY